MFGDDEENAMKSKALKCFILASTLAFFNCGDATDSLTDAANSIQAGVDNSQGRLYAAAFQQFR